MMNQVTKLLLRLSLTVSALIGLSIPALAQTRTAPVLRPRLIPNPTPPFNQCPTVGSNTSCSILIVITDTGVTVLSDPNMGPYDGSDDTLVGVQNNSSTTRFSLPLTSSTNIFGFEGDGLCAAGYAPQLTGCPFGPTGYEGPNTSFSNISGGGTSGVVNFKNGIPPGGSAYFSLEEALVAANITIPLNTTCPAPGAMAGSPYSSQLAGSGGAGGPYTFTLTAGSLGSLNLSSGGLVSGTPSSGGTLTFTITVKDSQGVTANQPCSLTVTAPAINVACVFAPASLPPPGSTTTPASITILTGASVTANCGVAGGSPQYNWTYTNRPSWLIPSGNTGPNISLSGIAPAPPPGTYVVTVTVSDSSTPPLTASTTVTIIVLPPLMISCNPLNPTGTPGANLSIACGASGGTGTYSWTYANLSFLTASGSTGTNITLNGVVPNPPPASYTVVVTLHDNMGELAQQTITISIGKGGGGQGPLLLLTCSPTSATVNAATQFVASCAVSAGTPPYNIVPTGVPSWLSASVGATGVNFSGTVPAGPPFTYSVGVLVTDSGSRSQSQTIAITVNGGKLSITCSPGSQSVAQGSAYSVGCLTTGGTGALSFAFSGFPAGSNPSGSNISGIMPGPPAASYSGTVTVSDKSSPPQTASQTVTIANTTTLLTISCLGPSSVAAGATYSATCTPLGGTPGYTVAFSGLPAFLTASGNTVSGIVPSPPPTSYTFTATATDSTQPAPQTANQTITVTNSTTVLGVTCTGPATVAIGAAYTATCTASGGTPGYSFAASGNPSWLTGTTSGTNFTLSGTAQGPAGPVNVTVTATDSGTPTKQTAKGTFAFTVTAPPLTLTCTPSTASVTAGTKFTSTCASAGGAPPYNYTITGTTFVTLSATTGSTITVSGTPPSSPASYNFSVVATDSTTPTAQTSSQPFTITILQAVPQGLTVGTNTVGVSANNANVVLTLGAPAANALTGTVVLSFTPDSSVTNVPANYDGTSGTCEAGSGFPAGALVSGPCNNTSTVNFAAGATTVSVQFGVGTVAGTWHATLTSLLSGGVSVLPSPAPTPGTFPVSPTAPLMIQTVKILNANNTGFDVKVTGIASHRTVASGSFTFTGTGLTGTTFTVPFGGADQAYFTSASGLSAGGTFMFILHFPYSGDPTAIMSVSVTLTDGTGATSAAVSGTQ